MMEKQLRVRCSRVTRSVSDDEVQAFGGESVSP